MLLGRKENNIMAKELEGWFDCLNGVAIELDGTNLFDRDELLLNVMMSAGITKEEVQWAKECKDHNYSELKDILIKYEELINK